MDNLYLRGANGEITEKLARGFLNSPKADWPELRESIFAGFRDGVREQLQGVTNAEIDRYFEVLMHAVMERVHAISSLLTERIQIILKLHASKAGDSDGFMQRCGGKRWGGKLEDW